MLRLGFPKSTGLACSPTVVSAGMRIVHISIKAPVGETDFQYQLAYVSGAVSRNKVTYNQEVLLRASQQ